MLEADKHTQNQPAKRHLMAWLSLAAIIVMLDQATKLYFDHTFTYGARHAVLPIFDFTLVYNRGAAFSFLATAAGWQRWFFTALGLGAAGFLIGCLYRHASSQPRLALALVMIIGGAIGNVIDRVAYGYVIDFLLFYWNNWYYPAFNFADINITCGALLLIWHEWLRSRAADKKPQG